MQQQSMQYKQQYLRQNILQSGYDPQDFVTFLQKSQQIQQIDIQNWNMNKIKHLVGIYQQYKLYSNPNETPPRPSRPKASQILKSEIKPRQNKIWKIKEDHQKQQQTKPSQQNKTLTEYIQGAKQVYERQKLSTYQQQGIKIQYPSYSPLHDCQFKAICKCSSQPNLINPQHFRIFIPKFQIIQIPGIFLSFGSKTQIWYEIKSFIQQSGKHIIVKRQLQDFQWLSTTLIRLYPYLILPELGEFKKEAQNCFQIRRIQIQDYFQHIVWKKQLTKSQLLMDFLTLDYDKIQKLKKNIQTVGFVKGVSFLKTDNGQINVQYSRKIRAYQQSCHNYTKKVTQIHQSLNLAIAKTVQSLDIVTSNMNSIVDHFADLHQAYNQLSSKFSCYKNPSYNQSLILLNNLFHGISDNIQSHSTNLTSHVKQYFKLNILLDKNLLRLEKYIKQQQKCYLQYKYNLYRKKERLLNQTDKWDVQINKQQLDIIKNNRLDAFRIMLPRETYKEHQIKHWIAFLYTNFTTQFQQFLTNQTKRYAAKYKLFVTDLLQKDKNYLETLTKFLTQSRRLANQ